MQPINCRQCKAIISVDHLNLEQRTARCPACNAVFSTPNPFDAKNTPAILYWPNVSLPKGLSTEGSEQEFTITWRWFGSKYIPLFFFCLFWDSIAFSFALGTGSWFGLLIPHFWVGVGLTYYTLAGLFNRTVIGVNANRLTIQHGPLPYWGNKRFDPIILRQLYTKERVHRHKNSTTYTYEVHAFTWGGQNQRLIKGLDTPQQALFLEQEIERFLGIKDEYVTGEVRDFAAKYQHINWNAWQTLAQANNLIFTSGKLIEAFRVYGNYWGHLLTLSAFHKDRNQASPPRTRLVIARNQSARGAPAAPKEFPYQLLAGEDVSRLFSPIPPNSGLIKGIFYAKANGREIYYEQPGVETDVDYLQFLIDTLHNLINAYPKMVELGGEAVPLLQPIAARKEYLLQSVLYQLPQEKDHPFRLVATQLLQDIASSTAHLSRQMDQLVCRRCLVHCGAHQVKVSGLPSITYYGCLACQQSNYFFHAERVVAVLDSQMNAEPIQQEGVLRANWMTHQEPFDFDAVEIVRTTDEDVERFAVQVGNDTAPHRQSRYKEMGCTILSPCQLSENTLRILQRTFGKVNVKT